MFDVEESVKHLLPPVGQKWILYAEKSNKLAIIGTYATKTEADERKLELVKILNFTNLRVEMLGCWIELERNVPPTTPEPKTTKLVTAITEIIQQDPMTEAEEAVAEFN